MTAPLTIIVPTLNSEDRLPACLAALVEGVIGGLVRELIVSDGGSVDATGRIAEEAGAKWLSGPPSRGGQLRRAAQVASGDWLLIVHSDTVLEPGWAAHVQAHLRQAGAPACFRLAFDAQGPFPAWVAGWANLRTRLLRLPYGDQGLLVSRSDYDASGGYPDQPLMEDVHLVRALARAGRPVLLDARATTSADAYRRSGWIRRGARNLWTLARYFAGVRPERLAESYRK